MSDVVLKCEQSIGEVLLLTAAVRDLPRSYPGMCRTDVRSPFPELWAHNPHVVPLDENAATVIECRNHLLDRCNQSPVHSIQAYTADLSERLRLNIRPSDFKPDLHLSVDEKSAPPPGRVTGPYWIVNAGCRRPRTAK